MSPHSAPISAYMSLVFYFNLFICSSSVMLKPHISTHRESENIHVRVQPYRASLLLTAEESMILNNNGGRTSVWLKSSLADITFCLLHPSLFPSELVLWRGHSETGFDLQGLHPAKLFLLHFFVWTKMQLTRTCSRITDKIHVDSGSSPPMTRIINF